MSILANNQSAEAILAQEIKKQIDRFSLNASNLISEIMGHHFHSDSDFHQDIRIK